MSQRSKIVRLDEFGPPRPRGRYRRNAPPMADARETLAAARVLELVRDHPVLNRRVFELRTDPAWPSSWVDVLAAIEAPDLTK
jgi:hypothetical protein